MRLDTNVLSFEKPGDLYIYVLITCLPVMKTLRTWVLRGWQTIAMLVAR